jgi:hypothetical protein
MSCAYSCYIDDMLNGKLSDEKKAKLLNHAKECNECSHRLRVIKNADYVIGMMINSSPFESSSNEILLKTKKIKHTFFPKKATKIIRYFAAAAAIVAIIAATPYIYNQIRRNQNNTTYGNISILTPVPARKQLTKYDIRNLIANSIDHFDSAEGSYTSYYGKINATVDYKVRIKNNPASYVRITGDNTANEFIFYDNRRQEYNTIGKTFWITTQQITTSDPSKYDIKNRYYKDENGRQVYYHRPDPTYMGTASQSLFNQQVALEFLRDDSKWEITGEEKYLRFDTEVIDAAFNSNESSIPDATKFKAWVERNTGIILKLEMYSSGGDLIQKLETKSIKLNAKIDDSAFIKDMTGYKPRNN